MKSKVDKSDNDKLLPVPNDLSTLSDVVKNDVVKKDVSNSKIKNIEDHENKKKIMKNILLSQNLICQWQKFCCKIKPSRFSKQKC